MSETAALAASLSRSLDEDALADLASKALEEGEEEHALSLIERAAEKSNSARLWQWRGLLERSLDEHQQALRSFDRAARLAPADPSIAHGHARTTMEAGLDAVPLYERARRLSEALGQPLPHRSAGGGSDGNFTGANGIPTLDGLGPLGQGYHTLDEHVLIETLPQRALLFAALLANLGATGRA